MKPDNNKGAALVELAIIIPVLFLFVFGICEFSWAMYLKNALGNAAREGARFAAVTPMPIATEDPRIVPHIRECLIFTYNPSDLDIAVTKPTSDSVKVSVSLQIHSFTNFFSMLDGQLVGEATMRYEL